MKRHACTGLHEPNLFMTTAYNDLRFYIPEQRSYILVQDIFENITNIFARNPWSFLVRERVSRDGIV